MDKSKCNIIIATVPYIDNGVSVYHTSIGAQIHTIKSMMRSMTAHSSKHKLSGCIISLLLPFV